MLSEDKSSSSYNLRVSTLIGPPGVGKSALALSWAHRRADSFPDGKLFIDMRGYSSAAAVTSSAALDGFLRAMGVQPESVPVDVHERSALFRTLSSDRRILLVIDN